MSGWPRSIFDWDILFLIPLPWWGPVIAPVLISVLMIIGGTLVVQFDEPTAPFAPRRFAIALAIIGVILALYVFMADAMRVANGGIESIRSVLPTTFNWQLFFLALGLMSVPIYDLMFQLLGRQRLDEIQV